jgi:[ribosomal protein S5]-alanine N-acetyltransferase
MDIVLKKFGAQDFADYFQLVGDARVMAMITERVIPPEEAKHDFEKLLASNRIHPDAGHFRVLNARQGRFVGLGKLELVPGDPTRAELGYMIVPECWGQGIASRLAGLLIETAREQLRLRSMFAIIDPANFPSRKILINHGFVSREFKEFDGLAGEVLELSC